jgi:hypothetical protein
LAPHLAKALLNFPVCLERLVLIHGFFLGQCLRDGADFSIQGSTVAADLLQPVLCISQCLLHGLPAVCQHPDPLLPRSDITAAQFLQRFVNNVPWAHLDIAGTAFGAGTSEINTSWAPGFGVALLDRLVRDYYEG